MTTFGVGDIGSRGCGNCGAGVPATDRFCTNCGRAVEAVPAPSHAAPAPSYYAAQHYPAQLGSQPDPALVERARRLTVAGLVVGAFAGPLSALSWVFPYVQGEPAPIRYPEVGVGRFLAITSTEVTFSILCVVALLSFGTGYRLLVAALRGGAAWLLAGGAITLWSGLPHHQNGAGYWLTQAAALLMAATGVLLPLGGWGPRPAGTVPVVAALALVVAVVEGEFLLREFTVLPGSVRQAGLVGLGLAGVLLLATRDDEGSQWTWVGWIVAGLIFVWGPGLVDVHWGRTDLSHLWRSSLGPAAMAGLVAGAYFWLRSPARQGIRL